MQQKVSAMREILAAKQEYASCSSAFASCVFDDCPSRIREIAMDSCS